MSRWLPGPGSPRGGLPRGGGPLRGAAGRRGATYTMTVVVTSTLLLALGGLYYEPTRTAFELAASQQRSVGADEALFAGVRWATRDAEIRGPGAERRARLLLAGQAVEVRYTTQTPEGAPRAEGLRVRCDVAATRVTPARLLEARLERDGETWRLVEVARGSAARR